VQIPTQQPQPSEVTNTHEAGLRAGGRRRGDAILLAFNHAFERGDLEVAGQLLIEYQKINAGSSLLLTVDRRKRSDNSASILSHLWERLRSKFSS
jgi:hypothetical protein